MKMSGVREKTITFRIDIVVEPDGEEFHAYCPALKGLHTCGGTVEEALSNARDAAIAYLRSLIKHGDAIPLEVVPEREELRSSSSKKRIHRLEDVPVGVA